MSSHIIHSVYTNHKYRLITSLIQACIAHFVCKFVNKTQLALRRISVDSWGKVIAKVMAFLKPYSSTTIAYLTKTNSANSLHSSPKIRYIRIRIETGISRVCMEQICALAIQHFNRATICERYLLLWPHCNLTGVFWKKKKKHNSTIMLCWLW